MQKWQVTITKVLRPADIFKNIRYFARSKISRSLVYKKNERDVVSFQVWIIILTR